MSQPIDTVIKKFISENIAHLFQLTFVEILDHELHDYESDAGFGTGKTAYLKGYFANVCRQWASNVPVGISVDVFEKAVSDKITGFLIAMDTARLADKPCEALDVFNATERTVEDYIQIKRDFYFLSLSSRDERVLSFQFHEITARHGHDEALDKAYADLSAAFLSYQPQHEGKCSQSILNELVQEIEATGGLIRYSNGLLAPKADPQWTSLGITIEKAHKALVQEGIEVSLSIEDVEDTLEHS